MNGEIVLRIDADGNGHCLYTDSIPLADLGTLEITRASSVEWSSGWQRWQVKLPDTGAVLYTDESREACIRWEIQHFNQQLLNT